MQLLLQKDEIIAAGNNQRGAQIVCHEGACWVTISGDSRDYLLCAGKRLEIFGQGDVCITALGEVRVQIVPCAEKLSWLDRLKPGWIGLNKKRALPQ